MGQSDIGVMLYGRMTKEEKFTKVVAIKDVPESGSDPEQIDVTTLESPINQYVEGRQDAPTQNFTFNYTKENYFTRVKPYCDGEVHEFLVIYADKTGTRIEGSATQRKSSLSTNSAIDAILSITPQAIEDIEDVTTLIA